MESFFSFNDLSEEVTIPLQILVNALGGLEEVIKKPCVVLLTSLKKQGYPPIKNYVSGELKTTC